MDDAAQFSPEYEEACYLALLDETREAARNGDPMELTLLQWPNLRIHDEKDLERFKRHCNREDNLDVRLDDFQIDILKSAFDPSMAEIFIKGCTKPGKGFSVALVANLWFDVFPDSRIVVVSTSTEHAKKVMFAEIASLRRNMRFNNWPKRKPFFGHNQPLKGGISDNNDEKHEIRIANPETGEGLSGGHGEHVLFIFDEASAVPDELIENARKQSRMIIALSNPRILSGWFRYGFPKDYPDKTQTKLTSYGPRRLITVGGPDCLNVRSRSLERPYAPPGGYTIFWWREEKFQQRYEEGQEIPPHLYQFHRPLIPKQMDYARYLSIKQDGDANKRRVFGDGLFPTEDADLQVILPSWLERHEIHWQLCEAPESVPQRIKDDPEIRTDNCKPIEVEAFGLDLAASLSGDESVLAVGGRDGVKRLHTEKKLDTMATIGWVHQVAHSYQVNLNDGNHPVAIDMDGLGLAVGHRMQETGVTVIEIRGNRPAAYHKDRYVNRRAELYGELARRLDPEGEFELPWGLPPDEKLREELTAVEKITISDGIRFKITPKDKQPNFKGMTLRQMLNRSPDRADAVVYLYAAVVEYCEQVMLADQFDPEGLLWEFSRLTRNRVLCKFVDGQTETMSEDEFKERFGDGSGAVMARAWKSGVL